MTYNATVRYYKGDTLVGEIEVQDAGESLADMRKHYESFGRVFLSRDMGAFDRVEVEREKA